MAKVYVVGTMDTKGAELRYAAERVHAVGAESVLVDVGTRSTETDVAVTAETVGVDCKSELGGELDYD